MKKTLLITTFAAVSALAMDMPKPAPMPQAHKSHKVQFVKKTTRSKYVMCQGCNKLHRHDKKCFYCSKKHLAHAPRHHDHKHPAHAPRHHEHKHPAHTPKHHEHKHPAHAPKLPVRDIK